MDGTTEIVLTPARAEAKEFKDIEFKDPLKKPLALDEGKWAVFCWSGILKMINIYIFMLIIMNLTGM